MQTTLREARTKAGLTQQMLADQLGLSRQAISEWERRLCLPDVNRAKQIARILGVDVNDIDFGERRGRSAAK